MIIQLQNFKDQVCKRIESLLYEAPQVVPGAEKPKPQKIAQVRRYDLFLARRLTSAEEVDSYLEGIREKCLDALEVNDGIQII